MDDIHKRLEQVEAWLHEQYVTIRTGQATPALLDSVKVESYGALLPLNQVGSVGVEDARTLRISTWDAGAIGAVETAIREADLGVSVVTDSAGVRVIFPELTSERRTQLLKLAKQKLEEARVSVRAVRDDVMKEIDKKQKDGEISEDERFSRKEKVQKEVEEINRILDQVYDKKESEISK